MSQPKTIAPDSRTDVQYQEIKLFIEGIQIPFLSINIGSSLGQLPQASISVPPQVGMMEISRFYNPKIHIFYIDPIDSDEKVLFSGVIVSSSISKTADGSTAMTFTCAHRYQLLGELLVDFSNWTSERTNPQAASEQAVRSYALSSRYAIGLALTGIFRDEKLNGSYREVNAENVADDMKNNKNTTSPSVMPDKFKDFAGRLVGMPSVLLNLWNQLKQGAYWTQEVNELMVKMYIPLVEDGLQLFNRIGGHFFLEDKIEDDRIDPCPDVPSPEAHNKPRLVPPCTRVFLRSSVQTDIGAELAFTNLQPSGELTDLMTIYAKFLASLDYEMLYLNSPAEVLQDPTMDSAGQFLADTKDTHAVDLIVKPQIPFYFSPRCNVLYPNMIRSLNVMQDDYSIPTRITVRNTNRATEGQGVDTFFRAPASIREAIAGFAGITKKVVLADSNSSTIKPGTRDFTKVGYTLSPAAKKVDTLHQNLQATLAGSHNKVGKFEQGRGIKVEKMNMPLWLSHFSNTQFKNAKGKDGLPDPDKDPFNYDALVQLSAGWIKRYGEEKAALNPWDPTSGLKVNERLLIASADYYYAMTMARSRAGQVDTLFNPYVVVGYPMDIMDSTPNHPSFHAYCTSVTHNITPGSIGTTISFVNAMTYTELANYYLPSVHPWLQYVLGLAKSQSIVNYVPGDGFDSQSGAGEFGQDDPLNPNAKGIADRFYLSALGVGAAAPSELYDFDTGLVNPLRRQDYGLIKGDSASLRGSNAGELNPMLSGVGNLDLAYRPIEPRDKVEERWKIKFVDLKPGNYNTNVIRVRNEKLAERDALEPGQSQWLDYDQIFGDASESDANV